MTRLSKVLYLWAVISPAREYSLSPRGTLKYRPIPDQATYTLLREKQCFRDPE